MIILYLFKHFEIELGTINIIHVNACTLYSLPISAIFFFLITPKVKWPRSYR